MLNIYEANTPAADAFLRTLQTRAEAVDPEIIRSVAAILERVRQNGDAALREYSQTFDGLCPDRFLMSPDEIAAQVARVDKELLGVMERAAQSIRAFHERQKRQSFLQMENGVITGQRILPLEKAGIYVPGGTAAYPSSVLMNAIPAKVAGVKEILMVTPPKKDGIHPAVIAAAQIGGVDRIYRVGGAQAIAALAYGTESIPRADVIVGPGNIYVAMAKKQVFGTVAIDMIAGPSEILILADKNANPSYIAADLLSQAEHDPLASSVLITDSRSLAERVDLALRRRAASLSRTAIFRESLKNYGGAVIVGDLDAAAALANEIAPEHLELMVGDPMLYLHKITNAGSVFLGDYAPEALGDYFAGPNHVLPTNRTARFSSPLSVDCFLKKSSFIQYTKEAMERSARDVIAFARSEGLDAHADAIAARLE